MNSPATVIMLTFSLLLAVPILGQECEPRDPFTYKMVCLTGGEWCWTFRVSR